jgi:hypothetical protein
MRYLLCEIKYISGMVLILGDKKASVVWLLSVIACNKTKSMRGILSKTK